MVLQKDCLICKNNLSISSFRARVRNGKTYYESYCLLCEKERNKTRCKKRYKEKTEQYREYSLLNKNQRNKYNREYHKKNKEKIYYRKKEYAKNNKEKIVQQRRERYKDPIISLRGMVSTTINRMLKKNGASKFGESCLKFLPYTVEELKIHIESQFEDWMSWDNQGRYELKSWDDNNSLTWTWNIDHIIPQSDLPYSSMKHSNFLKCWSLQNLRPYSSKDNILDGTRGVRHIKSKYECRVS